MCVGPQEYCLETINGYGEKCIAIIVPNVTITIRNGVLCLFCSIINNHPLRIGWCLCIYGLYINPRKWFQFYKQNCVVPGTVNVQIFWHSPALRFLSLDSQTVNVYFSTIVNSYIPTFPRTLLPFPQTMNVYFPAMANRYIPETIIMTCSCT